MWRWWRRRRKAYVPVIRLAGTIGGGGFGGGELTARNVEEAIDDAFEENKRLVAVALEINSPGGAPTQTAMIADRIRRRAAERNVPVLAFCEDAAASGGYWLACAADEIFVDPCSIIGSIGVVAGGFGAVDAIARLGVERRVRTAGDRKAEWDPFSPLSPEAEARMRGLLDGMHQVFIDYVKSRRGARLTGDPADLFSGQIWIGAQAQALGLVDGIGDRESVLKGRFGDTVRMKRFDPGKPPIWRRLGFGGVTASLLGAIEARLLWARIGL